MLSLSIFQFNEKYFSRLDNGFNKTYYLFNLIFYYERYPYAALMELAFGRNASRLVTIILGLTVFGGGAPNLLVGK